MLHHRNTDIRANFGNRPLQHLARRGIGFSACLIIAAGIGGCVNRETASIVAEGDTPALESFYVERFNPDQRGINILIMEDLIRRGFLAKTGPAGAHPQDVDAVVTYRDKWMWDITMYMLELDVTFRNPQTKYPIAVGNSYHTSLTRLSSKEMVEEVLTNIFNKLPVSTNPVARKHDASPSSSIAVGSAAATLVSPAAEGNAGKKYERMISAHRSEQERLNCSDGGQSATSQSCKDLAFQIKLLEEERDRELARMTTTGEGLRSTKPARGTASLPPWQRPDADCVASDQIDLARDRSAIEQAIQDYAYLNGIGHPHTARTVQKFRKLTRTRAYCGYMALRADILVPPISNWGKSRDEEQIHEFMVEKKKGKIRVTGCPTC